MRCDERPVARTMRPAAPWRAAVAVTFGLTAGCAAVHRPPATAEPIAPSADAGGAAEQATRDTMAARLAPTGGAGAAPARATADSVRGTATYLERIALPDGAVFEATLEDVSRADAASRAIGRTRRERLDAPPYRFAIGYVAADIDERHTYAVRARITLGDRLLFTTDEVVPVLTRGRGRDVALRLKRVVAR